MTTPRRSVKSMLGLGKSTIMIGAVVLTAGAALVVPSVAAAATTSTGTQELPVRLERACLRIPNLEIRTDNLIARLNGDASTRGSLLWLQAQIDDATAKGRTQLATVLENRLKVRTQSVKVLEQRQQTLVKLADLCRSHGVDI
jgi:hypothetical protein